jgi:hypothetical protein
MSIEKGPPSFSGVKIKLHSWLGAQGEGNQVVANKQLTVTEVLCSEWVLPPP